VTRSSDESNPAESFGASPGSDSPVVAPGISPPAVERLERLVAEVVDTVVSAPPEGPARARTVEAISQLGRREFVATAAISGRILDRRFRWMNGQFATRGPMARRLAELRKIADDLEPSRIKLGHGRSRVDEMKQLDRYFDRFAKTEPRLETILAELGQSRYALERDNASIAAEQAGLASEMEALREHAFLAERLDGALTARLERLANEDPRRAEDLRTGVLATLKARRAEILTQLAIATQGHAALELVEESNGAVLAAVAQAISTTATALRTAVLAAQAAASQRLALEHMEAATRARGAMAVQASALEAGMAARAAQTDALASAWSEMRAALDQVEARKVQALRSITSADRELTRPKPS
jgi:uncharacterized protein YaaN involved in tellurite resistance